MRRNTVLVALLLLWSAGAVAAPGQLMFTQSDDGALIELSVEDVAVIELSSNVTTGHSWQVEPKEFASFQILGSEYVEIEREEKLYGAPGIERIYIAGSAPGVSELELLYKRPQELEAQSRLSFRVLSAGRYVGKFSPSEPEEYHPPTYVPTRKDLPSHYDWCEEYGCTPVKDQGSCGSCWTYGTVGPLEQLILGYDGQEVDLSEQYLVSCNHDGWSCGGGNFAHAYHKDRTVSSQSEAGAVWEEDKPYTATNGSCSQDYDKPYRIEDWDNVGGSMPSVDEMKDAMMAYGPLGVCVCANSAMNNYNGGVFDGPGCSGTNHIVTLTGWDDDDGAWIMRNSWGQSWGENDGYMRITWGTSRIGEWATYVVYAGSDPRLSVGGLGSFQVLTGEGDPEPKTVTVRAMNADSLSWSVVSDQAWLTVSPTTGVTPADITVSASAVGLSDGTHTANLTFTAMEASNSPMVMAVELKIVSVPRITIPYSNQTPTLDGNLSSGEYDDAVVVDLDPDNPGEFLAWMKNDGQDVYFAVDATGDTDNDDYDVFAIYFDLNNDDVWPGSPQDEGRFYIFSNGNLSYYPIYNSGDGYEAGSKVSNPTGLAGDFGTESGHRVVETRVDITSSKMNLSAGDTFGLYLMYYDSVSGDFDIVGTWPSMVDSRDNCLYFGNTTIGQDGVVPENILVTPGSLGFQAEVNGQQTPPQNLNISASNNGNLTYSVTTSQPWIKLGSTSGSTPGNLAVWADPAGLPAGTVSGTVTVSAPQANNGVVQIPVSFVIEDQGTTPNLVASPTSLSFAAEVNGQATSPQNLNLSASDGSSLNYSASASANWIRMTATSGVTPGPLGVWVEPAGLSTGSHSGSVTLSAPQSANGTLIIQISVLVQEVVTDPDLLVNPTTMSFQAVQNGSATSPISLNLNSSTGGVLNYNITVSQPWIKMSAVSGATPAMVAVWADPAGLSPGTLSANLTVSAPGSANGMVVVAVTFIVDPDQQEPEDLLVAPGSLSFRAKENEAQTPPLNLNLTASRGGSLGFSAIVSDAWIRLSTPSSVTPHTVSVTVDPRGLPVGTHSGNITVTAPQSGNGMVLVPVTLVVEEQDDTIPPQLDIQPRTVSFEAERNGTLPLAQAVSVQNLGGGSLSWSASIDGTWLALDSYAGVCPSSVQLVVQTTSLDPAPHHASVIFNAPDQNPIMVDVWLTITEPEQVNQPPTAPIALSPINLAEVAADDIELVVQNATDPEGQPLTYYFEVYREGSNVPVAQVPVPEGPGTTSARLPSPLEGKTSYWWQAKAIDNLNLHGPWSAPAHMIVKKPGMQGGCMCGSSPRSGSTALLLMVVLGLLIAANYGRGRPS